MGPMPRQPEPPDAEPSKVQFDSTAEFDVFVEALDAGVVREESGSLYLSTLKPAFAYTDGDAVTLTEAGQVHLARVLHIRSRASRDELAELTVPDAEVGSWRELYRASQNQLVGEALSDIERTGKTDDIHRRALDRQLQLEVARILAVRNLHRFGGDFSDRKWGRGPDSEA